MNTPMAEAAVRSADTPRRPVRSLRPHARRVPQRRSAARPALFQPGEPQRVSSRSHSGCAAGARLYAIAGTCRRPRAQRRQRLRAGVEQERPGHAVADPRHRYASVDHLQRSRSAPPVRRRHRMARSAQTGSGRKRCADPGRRIAREVDDIFRRDPSIWLPDNLFLLQEYCPTTRTRASSGSSSSAASSSTRCV